MPQRGLAPGARAYNRNEVGESNELPRRITVLLVEDHEPTRVTTERLIKARGFEVVVAGTAADAVRQAKAQRIDFLISDVGLPDGNGYDLMEHLAENFGTYGVAVSGFGTQADKDRALRSGFLRHFTKPFTIECLDDILATAREIVRKRP